MKGQDSEGEYKSSHWRNDTLILIKRFRCDNLGFSKDSTACLCAMATSLFNVFNKMEFGKKIFFFYWRSNLSVSFLSF